MNRFAKTIFCDIDGTIFKYRKFETFKTSPVEVLPGVLAKMNHWSESGHMIILTTARPESMREHTENELRLNSVPWDRLIMGICMGDRHLINDMNPRAPGHRAIAHNLSRDEGFENLELTNA
tara:strand:+ start:5436 stop:5801 length:366 start_codon:yes stop_codon:yes gene_type:complete